MHDDRRTPARAGWTTGDRVAAGAIGTLTLGWFTVSWQVLGKPMVDAVGETTGGVCAVLVGVATANTVLGHRR